MQQWHSKWLPLISITKLVFFPDHFWHIREQKARYLLGRQMFLNPTPDTGTESLFREAKNLWIYTVKSIF